MSQPSMQANRNEPTEPLPTVKESMRYKTKPIIPSSKLVSLDLIPKVRMSLRNLLSFTLNLRYGLSDLGATNQKQTSVDKLLRTIAAFGCRAQEKS